MPARAWPLVAAAAAAVVGLVVLVVGLLVATVGAPEEIETLTLRPAPGSTAVVTAPGVLELRADRVEASAVAPAGRRVVLGVARTDDATAFLGKAATITLTGRDAQGRATTTTSGSGADGLPDPTTVDLWARSTAAPERAVLGWSARPGRWSLVAVAVSDAGAVAPAEVSLRWRPVHGSSPAVPLISVGLLLLVAGAVAAGVIVMQRRSPVDEPDEDEPTPVASRVPARDTLPTGPLTSELPVVPAGAVVSSRRAARAAREASQAAGVGPAPAAPDVAPPAPAPAQGAGEEDADAERPADPATTVLSLGRHRTADLFTSQPLPGRRGARSADAPAEPSAEGEEPAASPAFRFGPADPPPAAQAGPAGPAEHGRGEDA